MLIINKDTDKVFELRVINDEDKVAEENLNRAFNIKYNSLAELAEDFEIVGKVKYWHEIVKEREEAMERLKKSQEELLNNIEELKKLLKED